MLKCLESEFWNLVLICILMLVIWCLIFSAGPGFDPSVFVLAHALLCESAPVEACRTDYAGIHFTAGFALCFGLVAPYLYVRTAGAAFYLFRFGLLYVFTAGTFALEHNYLSYLLLYYYMKRYLCMISVIKARMIT